PALERPRTAARVMTRAAARPPCLIERLLTIVLPDDWTDSVLGDLHEEYARAAETSRLRADLWYVAEATRLIARCSARTASRRLGPAPRVPTSEVPRGDSAMRTIGLETRYAIRSLLKRPGLTALVVLTLAFGIGANAAVFAMIDALMLRAFTFP